MLRIALYIALCHAFWFAPRPFFHCVLVPCLVSFISLCPRERLALRLDLRSPLLLMQSPFLVQLLFAFCSSFRALHLFLYLSEQEGGGPRVVVSTAAFHARVRGSVPGLGGLKKTKNVSSPSTCESQYCGEPPWPRSSVLGLRPPGLEFRTLCLEDSVISIISPSSGGSPGPV